MNGDYSLTLVDVLDTFVVMGDVRGFHEAVSNVLQYVSFDNDVKVQVFEVTIRVLGGLLSAHIYASDPSVSSAALDFTIPGYNDELLTLARDLANRLLPAFSNSPTGLPFARVRVRLYIATMLDLILSSSPLP